MELQWNKIGRTFNRFIQEFRRLHHMEVQYLRVIERHKDGYPHAHAILQFPYAVIRVRNTRYFDRTLYKSWKALWKAGHSDYQKPRRSQTGTISYLMKYLTKNTTRKTIWKKLLPPRDLFARSTTSDDSLTNRSSKEVVHHTKIPIRHEGVKLCTWSRKFDWEPFKMQPSGPKLKHSFDY